MTVEPELSQPSKSQAAPVHEVMRVQDCGWQCLIDLLQPAGLTIVKEAEGQAIPGSHWGDDEAGLIGHSLHARADTPVHSILHEACHWLLMSEERRQCLHTDAKGTALEECAVCYLQVVLSERIPGMDRARMFRDMDSWGYSFRLGGSRVWFEDDAQDALDYLTQTLPHTNTRACLEHLLPADFILEQGDHR